MDLLEKINKNTTILNISNCNIEGVLDLNKFKNLRELYCANNKITQIINLSNEIRCIDCSYNNIEIFDICKICNIQIWSEISSPLKILYCQNNNLKKIKLQKYIQTLNCQNNQLFKIDLHHNLKNANCSKNKFIYCEIK